MNYPLPCNTEYVPGEDAGLEFEDVPDTRDIARTAIDKMKKMFSKALEE